MVIQPKCSPTNSMREEFLLNRPINRTVPLLRILCEWADRTYFVGISLPIRIKLKNEVS